MSKHFIEINTKKLIQICQLFLGRDIRLFVELFIYLIF
jgi:hypothetical protein